MVEEWALKLVDGVVVDGEDAERVMRLLSDEALAPHLALAFLARGDMKHAVAVLEAAVEQEPRGVSDVMRLVALAYHDHYVTDTLDAEAALYGILEAYDEWLG